MSTVYRKTGSRQFFKIEENGPLTSVLNKLKHTVVSIIDNPVVKEDVTINSEESTEEEFNTAYKEAMARIQSGKNIMI